VLRILKAQRKVEASSQFSDVSTNLATFTFSGENEDAPEGWEVTNLHPICVLEHSLPWREA
jgi:hypothetical protein